MRVISYKCNICEEEGSDHERLRAYRHDQTKMERVSLDQSQIHICDVCFMAIQKSYTLED